MEIAHVAAPDRGPEVGLRDAFGEVDPELKGALGLE
jgi:hypothetical protein